MTKWKKWKAPGRSLGATGGGSSGSSLNQADEEPQEIDLSERCWKDEDEKVWMTDFPPPPGFDGYQSCEWNGPDNSCERECTSEEVALLDAEAAAIRAVQRSEKEQLRDAWFESLKQSGTNESSAQ